MIPDRWPLEGSRLACAARSPVQCFWCWRFYPSSFRPVVNPVNVDAPISELVEELRHEHHRGNVTSGMRYISRPEANFRSQLVVDSLVQQRGKRESKGITSLNVQLLCECRRPNGARKSETIDLLVVVVFLVWLPVFIQIKAIDSSIRGGLWRGLGAKS